nr:universal stress protein [Streptomyces sp. Ag109_O5-1]
MLVTASHDAGPPAMAAPRRPRSATLPLGRVAHAVPHHPTCPVTVVPERTWPTVTHRLPRSPTTGPH